ncbi:MAG: signal peptide peptidase SppA [Bacteroidales bacterium]|nr:signal peptide peptidase SppA [Bacteroidales bacterium]
MKDFLKMMLASCLSSMIVFGICTFLVISLIIGGVATIISSAEESTVTTVNPNSVLQLDLTKTIYERTPSELNSYLESNMVIGADMVMKAIRMAKTDDRISGIYLRTSEMYNGGWAITEEIRNALIDFKQSGKFIYSYSEMYSQKAYYLSSIADSIFINPSGMLDFKGIAAETIFIKDMLDKLNVEVELIRPRNNAFKSAGEMYTMNHMSEANKTQIRSYISNIWQHVCTNISTARNISVDKLNNIANNLSAYIPTDAVNNGLIDQTAFEHDVLTSIAHTLGITNGDTDEINFIRTKRYVESNPEPQSKDKIAVIYAQGDVLHGKGTDINVYSSTITKAINDAADNKNVKAIVLRVNSPGGAVIASEIMTNAIIRAKEKKPIVVSMSDMAASAGYEISCNATKIVAMPTTITGSIGVFGIYPQVGRMLKNKLGITTDTILTNRNAAALSINRPLSAESHNVLVRNVEDFYKTFCMRVAIGRNLSVEYVDSIARGRVWTGTQAKELGLVDELGGMDVALRIAAQEAGITNYSIVAYPKQKDAVTELMEMLNEEAMEAKLQNSSIAKYYKQIEQLSNMEPLQARLPYFIEL